MNKFFVSSPICPRRGVSFNEFIAEAKEAAKGISKKLKVIGYSITDGEGNCEYQHNVLVDGHTDDIIQFAEFYSNMLEGKDWRWLKDEEIVKKNHYIAYH